MYAGGAYDGFVARLDPTGHLVYSTYLGGSGSDYGLGVATNNAGDAYVTGYTSSSNFPTRNALQATYGSTVDESHGNAFVTALNPNGSILAYSTYLGGKGRDAGNSIAVDAAGVAYVTGVTSSPNFPLKNAVQSTYAGGDYDAFAAKLNPSGGALLYSTFLGGSGYDAGDSIAIDSAGTAYVTGYTTSSNYLTQGAVQRAYGSKPGKSRAGDAFVAALTTSNNVLYSTYLGGNGYDVGYGIAVDRVGDAYVTGYTASTNFPVRDALVSFFGNSTGRAFVTKLNPLGSAIVYSTYLGGEGLTYGRAIASNGIDNVYVTGFAGAGAGTTTGNAFLAALGPTH